MAGGSFISRAGRYNRFLISWFLFKKQWILQMNTSEGMRLRRPFTSPKNSSMSRLMHWFDIALPISKTLFRCEKIFAASRRTKCAARTSAVFVTNKNRFLTFVSTDHDARLLDETKKFLQNDSFMNCHKCESAERAIQWVTPVEADKSTNAWRRNHRFLSCCFLRFRFSCASFIAENNTPFRSWTVIPFRLSAHGKRDHRTYISRL